MSLVLTLMQPLINKYERKTLDKNEILFSRYGALDLFQLQSKQPSSVLSPKNRRNAELSFGNVAKIPVIDGVPVSIGNTRSCTVADAENTSHLISLTFTPFVWGFTMYPSTYMVGGQPLNYVDYQSDFIHKADECTLALMAAVDTASRNIIDTNKNTYWVPDIANYYPVVGNALQVTQAQKDDFFNQLQAVMKEFDFYNTTYILGSPGLTPIVSRLSNQRTGNATNQEFQFGLGDFVFSESNRVTNATGVQATLYAIQEANLAVVNRNNPDAIAGWSIGDGQYPVTRWGTMMYPLLDMVVGTYEANQCAANNSGVITDLASMKQSFSWDTEICWLTPYNSSPSTKQTPIIKAEISTT